VEVFVSQTSLPREGMSASVRGYQRATVRYRCAPATLGRVYLNDDHEFQRACVINLSLKGIGLQLSRPLDPGQLIHICMKNNDDSKTYELIAQVCHCSTQPQGEYFIGCELTVPLTADDLDQLL
jgi:hypothetical protein